MSELLINHALTNVWVSPGEDLQVIFKPAKLTANYIKEPFFSLLWDNIKPPTTNDYFQFYQIGHLGPTFIGLIDNGNVWTTLAAACNSSNLIIDAYLDKGLTLPKTQVWYMIQDQKNILIAVKRYLGINFNPNSESLYIRFYKNSFFNLSESSNENNIHINGITVTQNDDVVQLQNELAHYTSLNGSCTAYKNGYYVPSFNLMNTKLGDTIEFVYDPSVYAVVEKKLSDLPIFLSTLDNTLKYLVHYNGPTPRGIDYQQDIDFFLINRDSSEKGLYYHKNLEMAVRMVTHSDYSLPTTLVESLAERESWVNPDTLYIRLNIRKSGTNRPLIFEKNEINELYKLPEEKILAALSGVHSSVPYWSAAHLEASSYTQIMRSQRTDITTELVTQAYGYHGIAKVLSDTPSTPVGDTNPAVFNSPPTLRYVWTAGEYENDYTALEYDANGLFINAYPPTALGSIYTAKNNNTRFVEFIRGYPTVGPWEQQDIDSLDIQSGVEFKAYMCGRVNGQPDNKWVDVTNSSYYSFINDQFTWLIDKTRYVGLVRTNTCNLFEQTSLPLTNGILKYTLHYKPAYQNTSNDRVMSIPMGQLTLYLNGYLLTENLDYFVTFPEIYIVNKQYLIGDINTSQKLSILFTGFCKEDFSRENTTDSGFVTHGLLSNNNKFDIRDNRVLRITVGGKLYRKEQLLFAESDSGVTVPDVKNGLPYAISEIIVPLYRDASDSTENLRKEAALIDEAVSNYLTSITPNPVFTTPNPIQDLHTLYSPFLSSIIFDLANNFLVDPKIKQNYTDNDVRDICSAYTHLLAVDPSQAPNIPDANYVIVHPHLAPTAVSLDLYQYRFVSRVISVFFNNRLKISGFINLT